MTQSIFNLEESQALFNKLTIARPNAKPNTLKSYVSYYARLLGLVQSKDPTVTHLYQWLRNTEFVQAEVSSVYKPTTQKNIYNAVVVVLGALEPDVEHDGSFSSTELTQLKDTYSNLRDEAHAKYEYQVKHHKKSEKQASNWVELEQIDALLSKLKRMANIIFKQKTKSKHDFFTLQDYILLLTYRHIPMRNDVAFMRVMSPHQLSQLVKSEQEQHNFLVGNARINYKFHINDYKTKRTFGNKVIDIPLPVNREIRRWLKVNQTGYFIVNTHMKPITANGITKLFTKLFKTHFDKNVSTSMLRHIYLSAKYLEDLKEKQADSYNMGHSLDQQKDYIKE